MINMLSQSPFFFFKIINLYSFHIIGYVSLILSSEKGSFFIFWYFNYNINLLNLNSRVCLPCKIETKR